MKFHYTDLNTCSNATGMVVVIDVIRAFTNAAFAFARGAKEIYPVSKVDEALKLKTTLPNALACGEIGGIPPAGFDFGNSPTQTNTLDLKGKIIIQRTSAGTQGIVRCTKAGVILAASLVVARATVNYIRGRSPNTVTFVITGRASDGVGDEDLACADYLEALLKDKQPDPAPYIERVLKSHDALLHLDPDLPAFPKSDLDYCTRIDEFDFAMPVAKEHARFVMRPIKP